MKLLDMMFGCSHKNYSFPISVRGRRRRSPAASVTGTYVVCLDCGQELPYDWDEMRVVAASTVAESATVPAYTGPKAA
jgi:hypothetical protein